MELKKQLTIMVQKLLRNNYSEIFHMLRYSVCCFIFLFLLVTCNTKRKKSVIFPDPYLQSFRNKNIKYVIAYQDLNSIERDTILVSQESDVFIEKGFMTETKTQYDSLGFIIRKLGSKDNIYNLVFKYFYQTDGSLIQQCRELDHVNWEIDEADTGKLTRTVVFKIDQEGRIISEDNFKLNEYARFEYSGSILIRSSVHWKSNDSLKYEKVYIYNSQDQLRRINIISAGKEIETYYFKDGLLDSMHSIVNTPLKYEYVFY